MILPLPQKAFCKGELDPTEISNAKRGPIPWNGQLARFNPVAFVFSIEMCSSRH